MHNFLHFVVYEFAQIWKPRYGEVWNFLKSVLVEQDLKKKSSGSIQHESCWKFYSNSD
jgi:hypothetical protein